MELVHSQPKVFPLGLMYQWLVTYFQKFGTKRKNRKIYFGHDETGFAQRLVGLGLMVEYRLLVYPVS